MDILKIGVLGIAGVLLALPLKTHKTEFSMLLSMAVCICIFVYVLTRLQTVMTAVEELIDLTSVQESYIKTIIKMLGITYVGEFSADICKEGGYPAIAGQIEMFAKVSLFALSMPILMVLLETIGDFL